MTLRQKAFQGVKWTTIAAIIAALVQLLQVAVLTRFLHKEEFGLMAIALVIIGISQIFLDMGLSNSIVYKQNVNHSQLDTLFWLNIFMGASIFLVLVLIAPLIAMLYETEKLINVIRGVAFSFLIIPVGQLYETLLKKNLQFKSLSTRDMVGKIIGLLVSVILAIKHFGVYALVFANLATAAVSVSLLVVKGRNLYRPRFMFSWRSLKNGGFISFGLYQMGENIAGYFNGQFDTLIIGKILGMEVLGIYNVAKQLAFRPYQIVNPVLTSVAFPVLSKLQNEIDKLKQTYLNIIGVLTMTNAPIYIIMILWAKPLVIIVFGIKWLVAVPVLKLLCVTAFCNSIGNPVGALQLARGRADLGFYWNLGMLLFMPLSMWIGSFWGLMGVTWGLTIFKIIIQYPAWRFFVYYLSKASAWEYFSSIGKPIILASMSGLVGSVILLFPLNNYVSLIAGGMLVMLALLALNYKFNREIFTNFNNFREAQNTGNET